MITRSTDSDGRDFSQATASPVARRKEGIPPASALVVFALLSACSPPWSTIFLDHRFEIRRSFWCEVSCAWTLQVRRRGESEIPRYVIGYASPDASPAFRLLADDGGAWVAIVEASAPDVILALHDLQTHASWPTLDVLHGEAPLAAFRAQRPSDPVAYVLVDRVGGDRPLVVSR